MAAICLALFVRPLGFSATFSFVAVFFGLPHSKQRCWLGHDVGAGGAGGAAVAGCQSSPP